MSQSQPQPEFFVDRSLGRHSIVTTLRRAGGHLHSHYEVYGDRDEEIADVEWLTYCGAKGLGVLSKDKRLRYRPEEIAAIRHHRVKAFILVGGSLTAGNQAAWFDRNKERIVAAFADVGPFLYAVHADRIVRVFPRVA